MELVYGSDVVPFDFEIVRVEQRHPAASETGEHDDQDAAAEVRQWDGQ